MDRSFLRARWPRLLELAIALWLVVSVLAFDTESSAGFNRLMIGIFVACCAVMAMWAPGFRFATTGLAVWLGLTSLVFGHASAFLYESVLASAAALAVLSMVATPARLVDRRYAAVRN